MNLSWKQIAAQQKANFGVAFGVADVVFDSAERLGSLNMEAMNSLIKDAQDNVIRSALPRLPFDVFLPSSFPPLFFIEKTQSYGRKVYDIAASAQAEIADVVRSRCDTYRDWFSEEGGKGGAAPAESAVVVLSGADVALVESIDALRGRGAFVGAQAADGCYDAAASGLLAARGATEAPPAELAAQLVGRWGR